ncbi:hypothetical protein Hanom_Chr09g00769171 [Helianthus anomalus]
MLYPSKALCSGAPSHLIKPHKALEHHYGGLYEMKMGGVRYFFHGVFLFPFSTLVPAFYTLVPALKHFGPCILHFGPCILHFGYDEVGTL